MNMTGKTRPGASSQPSRSETTPPEMTTPPTTETWVPVLVWGD